MTSFDQALNCILQEVSPQGVEVCDLYSAHRRVLAEDVEAPYDLPGFDNSSMDGYALRSIDTANATSENPVELVVDGEVAPGEIYNGELRPSTAIRIFTGAPIPSGADTVIEQEKVGAVEGRVFLDAPVPAGRNIRLRGEDIVEGQRVLGEGTLLNAAQLAVLASLGFPTMRVDRKPRVAILTTGDELAAVEDPLEEGKIRDSNSYALWSLVREAGCEPVPLQRANDSMVDLRERIQLGLSSDVLITSGGVSVGNRDLVLTALSELGVEIRFWKVNIKPGMPFAFGSRRIGGRSTKVPVFALPGNPVSTMVTFLQLVRPALLKMRGLKNPANLVKLFATMEHDYEKNDSKRHFVRGVVRNENDALFVRTTGPQSSGVLTSMSSANCLIVIPEDVTIVQSGDRVEIQTVTEIVLPE